jgi:hypothetical protein
LKQNFIVVSLVSARRDTVRGRCAEAVERVESGGPRVVFFDIL